MLFTVYGHCSTYQCNLMVPTDYLKIRVNVIFFVRKLDLYISNISTKYATYDRCKQLCFPIYHFDNASHMEEWNVGTILIYHKC